MTDELESLAGDTADLRHPVLLVEDNADDMELLAGALAELPVWITHVRTLGDALRAVADRQYAAVLLDMTLPDSSGTGTVARMAQAHDSIVVLTGHGDELSLAAIRAGADDYLSKGALRKDELRRAVMCAVERRMRKGRR